MSRHPVRRSFALLVVGVAAAWPLGAQRPPSAVSTAPWERRELMVPMRDGVRLFTVVMIPRAAPGPLPILLTRTPYGASGWGENDRAPGSYRELAADGYVFAFQDIRGRNRSEGRFLMNRPLRPRGDTAGTDEATDAWDAVDWLVKNVPNNNGRVGIFGVSYPGWLSEVPLVYPHPALRAVSPQAPMTDTWMGDDFFHQGAFRMSYGFEYSWGMEGLSAGLGPLPIDRTDAYDWYLSFPSLADLTERTGALRLPTWRHFVEHPAYDSVWQNRAFERAVRGVTVPTLTVGGWWDQEDIYGPTATYAALERFDTAGMNALVMGPWSHGQWARAGGDSLGNIGFGGATSDSFRLHIQAPWFRYWLKGQGSGHFPEAQLYDAGRDRWRAFERWPPAAAVRRSLFLRADHRLSFDPPTEATGFDGYVSDPANPVPYRPRPVEVTYSQGSRWARWMTEDQRFVSGRADVLSWTTAPLTEDVVIAGPVEARLFAATTGSDADWVVKLVDVYPDSGVSEPMRGYQLMIAGEILRGRYRRSFEHPEPIPPGAVEPYSVDLRPQFHTFRRGHRIQVQVQSSWFPLYDRNPQTYVPNIFEAPASAYLPRAHRIVRTAQEPSRVDVMVLPR
jgi:putative CocE/NonD family hydrolase